jgi:hypothetical protein
MQKSIILHLKVKKLEKKKFLKKQIVLKGARFNLQSKKKFKFYRKGA